MIRMSRGLMIMGLSGLLSLPLLTSPSVAQSSDSNGSMVQQGLPGRRIGGGTRAPELSLYESQKPLIALMSDSHLSLTTKPYPTLLFHVPVVNQEQEVEFVLYNSADELVYDGRFHVSGESGIMDFDMSSIEGLAPLEIDQSYRWYFSIVADDRSQDIVVNGWIQRVAANTPGYQRSMFDGDAAITTIAPTEHISFFGREGHILSDEASALYDLRYAMAGQDNDVLAEWNELLHAIGFSYLQEESVATLSLIPIVNEALIVE